MAHLKYIVAAGLLALALGGSVAAGLSHLPASEALRRPPGAAVANGDIAGPIGGPGPRG
jgi:hypothetical protein